MAIYSKISDEKLGTIKRSVDVVLTHRIEINEIEEIAKHIVADCAFDFERTFISYYLPYMRRGHGAWATSHFTPDMKIYILGFSPSEVQKVIEVDLPKGERFGAWISECQGINHRAIIYARNISEYFMQEAFLDGSIGDHPLERLEGNGYVEFRKRDIQGPANDHYRLMPDRQLEAWDDEGKIYTYQPTRYFDEV